MYTGSVFSSIHDVSRQSEDKLIDVEMITTDAYLEENNISHVDIMKVDVEGAEKMVISGASGLLSDKANRPRMILMGLYD